MFSKSFIKGMSLAVLFAFVMLAIGCSTLPKGTNRETRIDGVQITAVNAGIVNAEAQKTIFKVKCGFCGFEPEAITIDTPKAGKPYSYDFKCPRCGHKQTVVIQVAG